MERLRSNMDRLRSRRFPKAESQRREIQASSILTGRLDNLPPVSSAVVRVFISSTFSDMVCERNALMEHAYPKLKQLCSEYGLEFQVVDMRWGVREEAQDDHMTSSLCMKEIYNCQRLSLGPTFVILLGQKYGYRPFPAQIPAEEYEKIYEALREEGTDVSLLSQWFKKDTNVIPPLYRLVPVSSHIPNFANRSNPDWQEEAKQEWWAVFRGLQELLRKGALLCERVGKMSLVVKEKYFISVTEDEIRHGLLLDSTKGRHICLTRHIDNLYDHIKHHKAVKFLDLSGDNLDYEAQDLLRLLTEMKVPVAIPPKYRAEFEIEWSEKDGVNAEDHAQYLNSMCESFYQMMKSQIEEAVAKRDKLVEEPAMKEIQQHLVTCYHRVQSFQGRTDLISKLQRCFFQSSQQPLVVYGESGSGKTSVMAQLASLIHQWCAAGISPVVMVRFLGTTAHSCSITQVLHNLCYQIASNYGRPVDQIPDDYQQLITLFHDLLKAATDRRPLFIILDSLDQLSPDGSAHKLMWLPRQLPKCVHLVVSTLPNKYDLLPRLRNLIRTDANFVEILPLGAEMGIDIVTSWLQNVRRQVTPQQLDKVTQALANCSLPLYVKLVFDEICRWRSYSHFEETVLSHTIQGIIHSLFNRVEKHHGKVLVTHALSYITASRNGISESELEDVLSLDDDVLDEIFTFWVPPIRRIPPLLWTRIRDDLSGYLVEREACGLSVLAWYHRQFKEVARDRYLDNHEFRIRIHGYLADYYMGTWSGGILKPFFYAKNLLKRLGPGRSREAKADRKVPEQPLYWVQRNRGGTVIRYNMRKLMELPYHLVKCWRKDDLWKHVLCNYKWIHAKLKATTLQDVLADFVMARHVINSPLIQLLISTLRVGGNSLHRMGDSLAAELTGRLLPFSKSSEDVKELVGQCMSDGREDCALLPAFQCFDAPITANIFSFEGHTKGVTDLAFSHASNVLFSASMDGTVASWDLTTGEQIRWYNISLADPSRYTELFLTEDDESLICETYSEKSPLCIFDVNSGQLTHRYGQRLPGFIHSTCMTKNLIGREGEFIDIKSGERVYKLMFIKDLKKYVSVAATPDESHVLVGDSNHTNMYDIKSHEIVGSFYAPNIPSHVCVTNDNKMAVIGYCVDCVVVGINIETESPDFGEKFFTFAYKDEFPDTIFEDSDEIWRQEVSEMHLSRDSKFLVVNIKRCNIFVLSLPSGKATMMATEMGERFYNADLTYDSALVVALQVGANLAMWQASTGDLLSCIQLSSANTDRFILTLSPSQNFAATVCKSNNIVKLWDLNQLSESKGSNLYAYDSPVSMVSVCQYTKLAFVKQHRRLESANGYHYINFFGVDAWNLSNNAHSSFLRFAEYGQLLHMESSEDSALLVLHVKAGRKDHIYVLDVKSGNLHCDLTHSGCYHFQISKNKQYLVTSAKAGNLGTREVRLWDLKSVSCLCTLPKSEHAIFTYDSKNVVCITNEKQITVLSVESLRSYSFSVGSTVHQVQAIPKRHDVITATYLARGGQRTSKVSVWDIKLRVKLCKLNNVAPSGLKDITKDGMFAVDGHLQVHGLGTGNVRSLMGQSTFMENSRVCITYEGDYVIWADNQPVDCIKVCRVKDRRIVATVSTHSRPVSLKLLDHGYTVVAGCMDGHLLTFQLHRTEVDLGSFSVDPEGSFHSVCDHETAQFDPVYQEVVTVYKDKLPQATPTVVETMEQNARLIRVMSVGPTTSNSGKLINIKRLGSSRLCCIS